MYETYSSDSTVSCSEDSTSFSSFMSTSDDAFSHEWNPAPPGNQTLGINGLFRYNNGQQIKEYIVEGQLGEGAYGTVYKVKNSKTHTYCALKQQKHSCTNNEIAILTRIKESDILMEQRQYVISHLQHFNNDQYQFIIFPLLGVDLLQYVTQTNFPHFEGPVLKRIALQMLSGLDCLHTIDIIHRDLKLSNVMFTDPNTRDVQDPNTRDVQDPNTRDVQD